MVSSKELHIGEGQVEKVLNDDVVCKDNKDSWIGWWGFAQIG